MKAVNLEESNNPIQPSAFGIVLDGKGGAKYRDIAAAFKSAGLPLQTR